MTSDDPVRHACRHDPDQGGVCGAVVLKVELGLAPKPRPSLRRAVLWLAEHLEQEVDLSSHPSVALIADLFGHDVERVVRDVIKARASS